MLSIQLPKCPRPWGNAVDDDRDQSLLQSGRFHLHWRADKRQNAPPPHDRPPTASLQLSNTASRLANAPVPESVRPPTETNS